MKIDRLSKCPTEPSRSAISCFIFCLVFAIVLGQGTPASGAPFAENFQFTQPDGTSLTLWGEGDEFHAVFETTTGYTVVFDPERGGYFYAVRAAGGKRLVSTGVPAHHRPPPGLARHVRMDPEAVAAAARARQRQWDEEMGLSKRWSELKAQTLAAPRATGVAGVAGPMPAPPQVPTLGTKVGLTLLIDFPDVPAEVSQAQIEQFCNGDDVGLFNNGSVKRYFQDVSSGHLTYSNVVTMYIRMNHPKTYYNDTNQDDSTQGRLLISDALGILMARSDYYSDILPTFSGLTTDDSGRVVAFNVFFAGANSGVWSKGLWSHSSVLSSPVPLGNGMSVYRYQMSNIGWPLKLGTFCHENGHMLCGFPDIYDFEKDSKGGAGLFCLMNYGSSGDLATNPVVPCAYLRLAAGWATALDFDKDSSFIGTLLGAPAGTDQMYRFRKPGSTTEYFLLENRQATGRDAGLPASGIAAWHIDELGDHNNQSLSPNSAHQNYEVTLVQADNQWHFQVNSNMGDAHDLYYQGNCAPGYANALNDITGPHANWWDGSPSLLNVHSFSSPGAIMTFTVEPGVQPDVTVHYVNAANPTPAPPYLTWETAATSIQDAVEASFAGDTVLVTNGVYASGGGVLYGGACRVAIYRTISLRSVNGPEVTIIQGGPSTRCVGVSTNAVVSGFTLTGGQMPELSGGGIVAYAQAIVSNCVIQANVGFSAAGVWGGQIFNCTISSNHAVAAVGGAEMASLYGCLITGNSAVDNSGAAESSLLVNCTVVGNTAESCCGGVVECIVQNSVIWDNTGPEEPNYSGGELDHSCSTPLPAGIGNIDADPLFVNAAGGNYRLSPASPCINAGVNQTWMATARDLDGNPRIGNGTVDIGAYEVTSVGSKALSPSPVNLAVNVGINTDLGWVAAYGATSHDVYFGTANPPPFQGNQAGTAYDPGLLQNNTTYFWRIDERSAGETTTGDLWRFTTVPFLPGQAANPNPGDGASNVSVAAILGWTAGSDATSRDVYFGTANPPPLVSGDQTGTTYNPGTLNHNTTYYWRVDERNAAGTTTGVVWSFTTVAPPPPPSYVGVGTVAASTGAITPALPAGRATGDILLLFVETANQAVSISSANGGTWTAIASSPQGTGSAGSTTGVRLTAFWSRYNGTQGAPTTTDSGNHQLGRIIAIRGAVASGNPWNVTAGGVEAVSDKTGSIPGATTTVANTLVVAAIATALPDSTGTANFSGWSNANLASLTERTDNTTSQGNGGGLAIVTGTKSAAGAYGNTSVTCVTSSYKAMLSIAIKPPGP